MGESDTADCPPGGTPVESPDACPGDEEVEQIDEIIGSYRYNLKVVVEQNGQV